jgi:hypothetical protein
MEEKQKMKCHQLCSLLWDFQEMNHGRQEVKYILIHPDHFIELANDKASHKFFMFDKDKISFMGIPIIRTLEIEYVDFCV